MKFLALCLLLGTALATSYAASPKFAPYYDVVIDKKPSLVEVIQKTGQKAFTLAFALGGIAGCDPMWGAEKPIDDPDVLGNIKDAQAQGAEFIIATGGAAGPYLEHLCGTSEALAEAYKKVLDVVGTSHLDIDVEATIDINLVSRALAQVQRERPEVSVAFTLMVVGDDYGLTDALGVAVLQGAKDNGVRVDIVNPMTMEYPTSLNMGDSVIAAAGAVLRQMALIWPEKSDSELKKMLGVTPMIGQNFSGKIFQLADARQLVEWANQNHIGLLAFWSIGRDNGSCSGVSPYCSGISQSEFEFTKIFQGFQG